MKPVKRLISMAVMLGIFVSSIFFLAKCSLRYQTAYMELSRKISHESIGVWCDEAKGEER